MEKKEIDLQLFAQETTQEEVMPSEDAAVQESREIPYGQNALE